MSDPADDFVNVWTDAVTGDNEFHREWLIQASAKHSGPLLQAANALRKIYPNHSIVMTPHDVIHYPKALFVPLPNAPMVTTTYFMPLARSQGEVTGVLVDSVEFGAATVAWNNYDFIVYAITYPRGLGTMTTFCVLHQGPEEPARRLVMATGLWSQSLHEEIWVYNQGWWQKDHPLWVDVQKADWKDVILKEEFKKALHKDVYGFFKSEAVYRELGIPWKRGLIMYGPPGNGKTISIKVIMKTCDALGFAPLYVKSFQNFQGEEVAMQQVFDKARQLSPCVIVLEDLDALINDRNRSFFLNQLDGLQGNDGLLVIGTTNHFERLDPGLSSRPSRFDRKYLFDDPNREERALYAKYWQEKLKSNKEIDFPDSLVDEVAEQTSDFSFAYLKEAFVSSLVTLAGWEGDGKPTFASALLGQIKILRKQLDKSGAAARSEGPERDYRALFDALSGTPPVFPQAPGGSVGDLRALLDMGSNVGAAELSKRRIEAWLSGAQRAAAATPLVAPSAWDSSTMQLLSLAQSNVSPRLD
ncbi:P-loop containing nucleoside triphosphate hydrolase protein [Mycena pura]|uniref:P-loop containing nucleoside triphosphate hydrolase protein n=1 Tax=Mycena pura TaxID=153505 RepID=A0AAD6YSW1_9AGAR|nr:P-loop containing nucleoside triphosphate hydrolase protein [Mycena pura]